MWSSTKNAKATWSNGWIIAIWHLVANARNSSKLMIERWTGERRVTSLITSCQKQSTPECKGRDAASASSAIHLIVRRLRPLPLLTASSVSWRLSASAALLLNTAVRAGAAFCTRRCACVGGGKVVCVKAACWSSAIVVKKTSLSLLESASSSSLDLVRVHIHRAECEPAIGKTRPWRNWLKHYLLICMYIFQQTDLRKDN